MFGGCFLAYEGAHKIIHALRHDDHDHDIPAVVQGTDAEAKTVSGAIRTDFILSAEIMVIALKDVIDEPVVARAVILALVGALITVVVYGVVALIVKMDDIGLKLASRPSAGSKRTGHLLVVGMPKVLAWLSVIGTAAMLWVGGHILLVGFDELGWEWPYHLVHELEHLVEDVPAVGGVLSWLVNTLASAIVGFAVGAVIALVVDRLPRRRPKETAAEHG
jgi:predicted DNA repair protein MutK